MFTKRPSKDRGFADHGWLKALHTFSFADYHDPQFMGFRNLRVINEDRVAPGAGFPTHGHMDMEIITYPLAGFIAHKDSTGGEGEIGHGDVQVMSAGKGVRHSEFNASQTNPLHLLQIWLLPHTKGVAPRYDERRFDPAERQNALTLLASGDAKDDALFINTDVKLYGGLLQAGRTLTKQLDGDRFGWIQVARGTLDVNGETLEAGDGLGFGLETELEFKAGDDAEFLLFDLP
ncbi:MAG: pirin family protein [Bdellovibrionales bacterium]